MNRTVLIALSFLAATTLLAQDVASFTDIRDRFWVFDKGVFSQIETQRPLASRPGGNYIAYASFNGDIKVYRNGKVTTIEHTTSMAPVITDHYLTFSVAGALKVWDGDTLRTLCYNTPSFVAEDSVVGWYDDRNQTLNAFYNGRVTQLEDALANWPVENWRSGDNVLVWITSTTKRLRAFYRGEIHELASLVQNVDYKAGCDVVAFQDPGDQGFKIFSDGEVHDVDVFMPKEYRTGKGLVAYIDQSGALKVFQHGKVRTAMDFTPQSWSVMDSLVVIRDQNHLVVFQDGNLYTVAPYYPDKIRASWGTLAYLDNSGNIQIWHNGSTVQALQKQPVRDFTLDRSIMVISTGVSDTRVWWKGSIYEP